MSIAGGFRNIIKGPWRCFDYLSLKVALFSPVPDARVVMTLIGSESDAVEMKKYGLLSLPSKRPHFVLVIKTFLSLRGR